MDNQIQNVQVQNNIIQPQEMQAENQQEVNLFLQNRSREELVLERQEKLTYHPEKTENLDSFGMEFHDRVSEKVRREKQKNKRSRLYVKAENEKLLNKAESEYAGKLTSMLGRHLPEGINPMQAEARDVAQFMIYGGEEEERNKVLAALFFSQNGSEEAKAARKKIALDEMAHILLAVDISRLHLESDQEIANHAETFERLTGQVAAFDSLAERNGYFDTLTEAEKKPLKKKLEALRAISAYYVAEKALMRDPIYSSHYNDEITYNIDSNATQAQKALAGKLMRAFVLGRIMMKLNGVSARSLNKHKKLFPAFDAGKNLYRETVRTYGTAAKQKEIVRGEAIRVKTEKKTGLDKLTLTDFTALLSDEEAGRIYFDKKGLQSEESAGDDTPAPTLQNYMMKERLLLLIEERMHVEPGSTDDLRLRLTIGLDKNVMNKKKALPLSPENLRIALGYMNQKTSLVDRVLRKETQTTDAQQIIAKQVSEHLGAGYDAQELAYANKTQAVVLRRELQEILKKGKNLKLPLPAVSTAQLNGLVKNNITAVQDEIYRQVERVHRILTNLNGGNAANAETLLTNRRTRVMDHISALVVCKMAAVSENGRKTMDILLAQYARKLALDMAGDRLTASARALEVRNLSLGGSDGLDIEVEARRGNCKAWAGKDRQVTKGTLKLTLLCNTMQQIASMEKKAMEEGLTAQEATAFINTCRDLEKLLAKEDTQMNGQRKNADYGLMGLVANQLSGTRFKQGYKDAMKRFRDAKNHPERGMGFVSCAKRLVKAATKKVNAVQAQAVAAERPFDLRDEFKKTDRVKTYLKHFKGTELEIARFFVMDRTPDDLIKNVKTDSPLARDIVALRDVLKKMREVSAVKVTLAGVPVRLVRDRNTIEITIDNRSLMLPFHTGHMAERIDGDICAHMETFGKQEAIRVLEGLMKPDRDMTPGDVGRLRQRCLSILKKETGKNAGYFSNVTYQKLYDYATSLLRGEKTTQTVMAEIDRIENTVVGRVNGAEALAFLQRTELNPAGRIEENSKVEIKRPATQANNDKWSPEERKIKNFIADLIFGEESWETTDKYIEEDKTDAENRAKQKNNRIFDMLLPSMLKAENKGTDAFLLMVNRPELIRQTVEKMAFPWEDDDENEENVDIAGLKETIIAQLEEVVVDPDFDEIRKTEGNFFMKKETLQKTKLAAGLSMKADDIKKKLKKAEETIDTKIEAATLGLQKEIDKAVDSMFGTDIKVEDLKWPGDDGISAEEEQARYNKLVEIGRQLDERFDSGLALFVRRDPFGPDVSKGDKYSAFTFVYGEVRKLVEAQQNRQENFRQNNPFHGSRILKDIIEDATKGKKGQGRFTKLVLKKYFHAMAPEDRRRMFASALREITVKKGRDEIRTQEQDQAYKKELEGNFLGGLFKGAGPLFQKMLQGLPESSLPDRLKLAVKDMKSNLTPIPEAVVKAELLSLVQRSHEKLTKIDVEESLGAASVGQAFLCRAYGPNLPAEGKQVVVKILRPDARNRMAREKEIMRDCARETDKTGGMLATYDGQLKRFNEEVDLTIEANNVLAGQIYNKGALTVQSMKLSDLAEPTENAMIVEMAPGTTVDKYMEEIDKKTDEILDPFYQRNDEGAVNKEKLFVTRKNAMKRAEARTRLLELKESLEKRQKYIVSLAEKWVTEGIYGAGFYHGDLHAGNIMVDDNGVTVIDFGNCTQLTKNQQEKIMLMMTSATFKDADGFLRGFHALLENTSPEFYQKNEGKLKEIFESIMALGTEQDVGQRILAALIKAQELGFEMPAAVFNFSQAQQRLHNTIEDMNTKLKLVHQTIVEFDMMDTRNGYDPITRIMGDQRVEGQNQPQRIAGLKDIRDSANPDPQPVMDDYASMTEQAFRAKYIKPLEVPQNVTNSMNQIKESLENTVQLFINENYTDMQIRQYMPTYMMNQRRSHLFLLNEFAKTVLSPSQVSDMESDLSAVPMTVPLINAYAQTIQRWFRTAKQSALHQKEELEAAFNGLNEIRANPGNFTEEETTARKNRLLEIHRKKLQNKEGSLHQMVKEHIEDMLHLQGDPRKEADDRRVLEADWADMFADAAHKGTELKAAYDEFRKLQEERGDDAPETDTAREKVIALVEEITLMRLNEMIEAEKEKENKEVNPQTFFDMMGQVLDHNKLASFRRLGIVNIGKLVTSGKLGVVDAVKAFIS